MVKKEQDDDVIEINFGKHFKKLISNPWIVISFVLALVLIWALFLRTSSVNVNGMEFANPIIVGQNVISFIESVDKNQTVSLVSSEVEGTLIKIIISFNGENVPIYATLDGKYIIPPDALAPLKI